MPAEDEIEMVEQEPASPDVSNHPPSVSSDSPTNKTPGYRQFRGHKKSGKTSPFATKGLPLANMDSIAAPPHLAISHHGSGRFSVDGRSMSTVKRTRWRAILFTLATVLAFFLLVFLATSASSLWRCSPWDEYLHSLHDSADSNYLIIIGSLSSGISMTLSKGPSAPMPDARMAVQSASGWVSTVVILALVQNKTLSLDDTPQRHIPSWGGGNGTGQSGDPRMSVTLRSLLARTSGLTAGGEVECGTSLVECAGRISDSMRGLAFEPGKVFNVSKNHLSVAAAMAEAASGQSFDTLFRTLLAQPLRMTSSPSYSREGAVVSGGIDPSQGLEISPRDYALFLESLLIERSVPSPRESLLAGAARLAFQDATTGVETFDRSKLPNTDLPGVFTKWHLSLGHWMECYWDDQEGRGTEWEGRCGNGMARRTLHSDVTGQGFYPVLSSPREPGGKQHFALVVAPPADATDTGDAIAKAIRTYRLIYSDIIALSKMIRGNGKRGMPSEEGGCTRQL
mmetsp:Transcript_28026/g.66897  ORF Transcript_28026/g.66897 Transcript_28026/m.66897 type:complete len:510 (-) Transcript_28026:87-1616(-)